MEDQPEVQALPGTVTITLRGIVEEAPLEANNLFAAGGICRAQLPGDVCGKMKRLPVRIYAFVTHTPPSQTTNIMVKAKGTKKTTKPKRASTAVQDDAASAASSAATAPTNNTSAAESAAELSTTLSTTGPASKTAKTTQTGLDRFLAPPSQHPAITAPYRDRLNNTRNFVLKCVPKSWLTRRVPLLLPRATCSCPPPPTGAYKPRCGHSQ